MSLPQGFNSLNSDTFWEFWLLQWFFIEERWPVRPPDLTVALLGCCCRWSTNLQHLPPSQEVFWPIGGPIVEAHFCISSSFSFFLHEVALPKPAGFVPLSETFCDCSRSWSWRWKVAFWRNVSHLAVVRENVNVRVKKTRKLFYRGSEFCPVWSQNCIKQQQNHPLGGASPPTLPGDYLHPPTMRLSICCLFLFRKMFIRRDKMIQSRLVSPTICCSFIHKLETEARSPPCFFRANHNN